MKQPEDNRTIELSLAAPVADKRGRGRPAKADALTPAQRAKRYRDARRAAGVPRAPSQHETEFQVDYRPTWKQHDEELEQVRSQVGHLHRQLEAAKAVIAGLQKDQALMIAERAAAFKAADQAKAELQRVTHMSVNTGKLANQILELEADKAQLEMEKRILAQQGAGLVDKVRELELKLKKRDALRKKNEVKST